MSTILNIYGPSGVGKTIMLREALSLNVLPNLYTKILGIDADLATISLSMMPIPKYRDVVHDYLGIFGLDMSTLLSNEAARMLAKTIFNNVDSKANHKDFANRLVETLSAGEMRRLSLLRALAQQSDLVVIDEPFANSDEKVFEIIRDAILSAPHSLIITHHPIESNLSKEHQIKTISASSAQAALRELIV